MNKVLIGIDKSGSFRVYLTISTELVEDARTIHRTSPLATAGLGRTLTGAALMGIMLKNESDRLTVQFKGEGPAKQILASADGSGNVKGYISNPDVDMPLTAEGKLDVGGSLGLGQLTVIKDLGLKEPYMGKIDLVSGEIADDLTAYFYISEQQNTSVALGVMVDTDLSVKAAGGMIIQMLPDAQEGAVEALEKMLGEMKPLTSLIAEVQKDAVGKSERGMVELLLSRIFKDIPLEYSVEILGEREIGWKCDCSKDRMASALLSIGEKDLREITEEDGKAELTCHFCNSKYNFTGQELEELLDSFKS